MEMEIKKHKEKYGGHLPPALFSRVEQIASLVFAKTGSGGPKSYALCANRADCTEIITFHIS